MIMRGATFGGYDLPACSCIWMVKSARKPAVRATMSGGCVGLDHSKVDSLSKGAFARLWVTMRVKLNMKAGSLVTTSSIFYKFDWFVCCISSLPLILAAYPSSPRYWPRLRRIHSAPRVIERPPLHVAFRYSQPRERSCSRRLQVKLSGGP
jgi:hypothetical protein